MDNNAVKWLWFQRLFGTGTRRAHEAFEYFGSTDELLSTPLSRIESDPFLTETEKSVIKSPDFAECEKIIAQAKDRGAPIKNCQNRSFRLFKSTIPNALS